MMAEPISVKLCKDLLKFIIYLSHCGHRLLHYSPVGHERRSGVYCPDFIDLRSQVATGKGRNFIWSVLQSLFFSCLFVFTHPSLSCSLTPAPEGLEGLLSGPLQTSQSSGRESGEGDTRDSVSQNNKQQQTLQPLNNLNSCEAANQLLCQQPPSNQW